MKVTKQSRREAKELFRSCLVDGLLDDNRAREAVNQVLRLRPRGYVAILSYFQRLVKLDIQRRLARVESAVPLTPNLQSALQTTLERRYGRGLSFQFTHRPELLGGVRVQVGSDVYDGSVLRRLSELEDAFASA